MDYYTPQDVHRNWKKIDELQTELEIVEKRLDELEYLNREWNNDEELEYRDLEKQQTELIRALEAAYEQR